MLAFVLGEGGSCGAFQVGALKVLAEAGIKPDMVIGTSVGALNAAFFASDPTPSGFERLRDIWLQINQKDIYPGAGGAALFHLLQGKPNLFRNDNLHALLLHYLPFEHFRDLALPCYAVATDIDTGDIVAFGDYEDDLLIDGLMSSAALVPAHPPCRPIPPGRLESVALSTVALGPSSPCGRPLRAGQRASSRSIYRRQRHHAIKCSTRWRYLPAPTI